MGQWRNEFNRKWDPYGGREFGEDLEASLMKRSLDEGDKAQSSRLAKFFKNRCMCCKRKYSVEKINDDLCLHCLAHAACSICHVPLRDGRGDFLALTCKGCSPWVDKVNTLFASLRGPPNDAEKQGFLALKQTRPKPVAPKQQCDNPKQSWVQEYRDCFGRGKRT